ncbi:MAG: carbonic anhydrase [Aureliella sp.]
MFRQSCYGRRYDGAEPGELFVHRNIANLVPNNDICSMSVIKYAVENLQVAHIVVCGHYGCGGVAAAMQTDNLGILNPWLGNIRDVCRLHQVELESIQDEHKRYNRLVELNVQEQCINVLKIPEVQAASRDKRVTIHGWVFDIATGRIHDLELDLDAVIEAIKTIYAVDEAE